MAPSDLLEFLHRLGVANPYGRGWLTVLLVFFLALLFTWRFLPHVRRFALKVGWADLPNERRLNREPLPNAGGSPSTPGWCSPWWWRPSSGPSWWSRCSSRSSPSSWGSLARACGLH